MHGCKVQSAPTTTVSSLNAYSYIQQSGRSVKTMNAKNSRKKSQIHVNADANITGDFGDGDISLLGVGCHTFAHTATSLARCRSAWLTVLVPHRRSCCHHVSWGKFAQFASQRQTPDTAPTSMIMFKRCHHITSFVITNFPM